MVRWKKSPLSSASVTPLVLPLVHSPLGYSQRTPPLPPAFSATTRPFLAPSLFAAPNSQGIIGGGSVFATNAPTGVVRCPIQGCGQTRISNDCQRRYCRKHCTANGGCSLKTHVPPGTLTQPAPTYAPVNPAPTLRLPSPRNSTVGQATAPSLPIPVSSTSALINTPARMSSPDHESLDARPNARFRSHMPAIFTDQWKREQELAEKQ